MAETEDAEGGRAKSDLGQADSSGACDVTDVRFGRQQLPIGAGRISKCRKHQQSFFRATRGLRLSHAYSRRVLLSLQFSRPFASVAPFVCSAFQITCSRSL